MSPADDPFMSGRSIQSSRHLECQNVSIISDYIGFSRWLQENGKKVRRRNLIHIEEDEELDSRKNMEITMGDFTKAYRNLIDQKVPINKSDIIKNIYLVYLI